MGSVLFVEWRPVDVTTWRTTPRMGLGAHPLATPARVNGGVLRMFFSWRPAFGGTPNRCVSVRRPVGPGSMYRSSESPLKGDLPPPRAQENVAEKAQPRPRPSAEMGRSTDADGERECARETPPPPLHRPLDNRRFIDAPSSLPRGWGTDRSARYRSTWHHANHALALVARRIWAYGAGSFTAPAGAE